MADRSLDCEPHDHRIELTAAQAADADDRRKWFNGLLRWQYIIPRAVLMLAVWAFFAYGFDPLLRYGLVSGSESVIGARVDVELVRTRFFPPEFELKHVGITDPRRTDENAVTFDEVLVRLAGEPLLHREYVVREAVINGVRLNVDRVTDGSLATENEGEGVDFEPLQRHLKLLGLRWYDELEAAARKQLDPQSLETVQVAESVESEWQERIDDLESRLGRLQQRVDAVEQLVKVDGNAINKLDAYTRATTEVRSILQESQRLRDDVRNLPTFARRDVTRLDDARRRDIQRLQQRIQSLPITPQQITESLVGPELSARLSSLNQWIGWVRRYLSAGAVAPPPAPRRGEWIQFPRTEVHPTFVLELLSVSGEATKDGQSFGIAAECRHVTSDPQLYGRPTEWTFEMAGPDPLEITGRSDLTDETPLHEVVFDWQTIHPLQQSIGDEQKLAITLSAASTHCSGWLRLDDDELQGQVNLRQAPLAVTVSESSDEFAQRWIAPAFSSVTAADTTLHLTGSLDRVDWRVESDLGPQISNGLRQLVTREVDAQRNRLMAKADSAARDQWKTIQSLLNNKTEDLLAELSVGENHAKQALARLTDDKLDVRQLSDKLDLDRLFRR
jgi:uncharacterized protein (TIGR03545 family)